MYVVVVVFVLERVDKDHMKEEQPPPQQQQTQEQLGQQQEQQLQQQETTKKQLASAKVSTGMRKQPQQPTHTHIL